MNSRPMNGTASVVSAHPAPPPTTNAMEAEDTDGMIQGLTSGEIQMLAQKVYDLLLDELRLEAERHGRHGLR